MRIGYARVYTGEQKMDLQMDAFEETDVDRVYTETTSGAAKSRPELERCLDTLREGDTLIVWRLDRFGRSLNEVVENMETLEERGVELCQPHRGDRHDDRAGAAHLPHLRGPGGV